MKYVFMMFFITVIIMVLVIHTHLANKMLRGSVSNFEGNFVRKDNVNITDATLFVYILTGRYNFKKREIQRNSGLFDNIPNDVVVKYIIGDRSCNIPLDKRVTPYSCHGGGPTSEFEQFNKRMDEKLEKEINKYGDIVQVKMVDYYRALPRKIKLVYEWGLKYTTAQWFMKVDDDCYFNTEQVIKNLASMDTSTPAVIGSISKNIKVLKTGKWEEHNYNEKTYPPFPLGSRGHIENRLFIKQVVERADELFEYQGEDVSIGIWVDEFFPKTKLIDGNKYLKRKNECKKNHSWICGHDYTEDELKRLTK